MQTITRRLKADSLGNISARNYQNRLTHFVEITARQVSAVFRGHGVCLTHKWLSKRRRCVSVNEDAVWRRNEDWHQCTLHGYSGSSGGSPWQRTTLWMRGCGWRDGAKSKLTNSFQVGCTIGRRVTGFVGSVPVAWKMLTSVAVPLWGQGAQPPPQSCLCPRI